MASWKNRIGILIVVATGTFCLLGSSKAVGQDAKPIPGTPYKRHADVIYGRKHGMALTMDVLVPPKPNGAAVIYAASSGWQSHHAWIEGTRLTRDLGLLLDRGYTVFGVVHGSVPKFTIRECYADMYRSIRFIRHHAASYGIDPDRIGITGASAGGVISLMMGAAPLEGNPKSRDPVERESTRIQAVGCFNPASDLVNFEKEGVNVLRIAAAHGHAETYKYKDYDPKRKVYTPIRDEKRIHQLLVEHSPITHVTADDAPTLIVHGTRDKLVRIEQQSAPIIDKLKAAGVTAQLVATSKGHGGIGLWRNEVKLVADWFDQHLARGENLK